MFKLYTHDVAEVFKEKKKKTNRLNGVKKKEKSEGEERVFVAL